MQSCVRAHSGLGKLERNHGKKSRQARKLLLFSGLFIYLYIIPTTERVCVFHSSYTSIS